MEIPIVSLILNRLKILIFHLVGYLKRALCCFSRRRRDSCESIPLTGVGVVPSSSPVAAENWLHWEDDNVPHSIVTHQEQKKSSGVHDHIETYRQQTMALARRASEEVSEQEPEANYFQDMVPTITKQKKIFVQTGRKPRVESVPTLSLGVQIAPVESGGELGEWDENPGWDDDTQLDSDQSIDLIMKEKRRLEREKRIMEQQQRRLEKHGRPAPLGARIS